MRRSVVFCLVLCLGLYQAKADLSYEIKKPVLSSQNELIVIFMGKGEYFGGRFKIRPDIDSDYSRVSVWNNEDKVWVSSDIEWVALANLEKQVLLRIKNTSEHFRLGFKLLDVNNGNIYQLPPQNIWSNKIKNTYWINLNENLISVNQLNTSEPKINNVHSSNDQVPNNAFSAKFVWIGFVLGFALIFVAAYLFLNDVKISQWKKHENGYQRSW